MKTRIISIVSIATVAFALFSCTKVAQSPESLDAPVITIEASIPDQATKVVAVTPSSGVGLDWNWEEGDQISVASGDVSSLFEIRPGFDVKNASFIGKKVSGNTFSVIYPGKYATVEDITAASINGQVQTGTDSKEHLKYFALLEDVNDYQSFEFSSEWALEHGGAFKQCGVLRFALTLPEDSEVVNSVTIKAGASIFHSGNAADALTDRLSMTLSEATLGEDKAIIAWMTTSWWDDVIPAGTQLTVSVDVGKNVWVADITPSEDKVIMSGYVNNITIGADVWGHYADGNGTLDNPWVIKTPDHLTYMNGDLVSGETRYFKLGTDIDMAGIEWEPLNNTEPYDKFIHFDGDGYTISNLTIKEGAENAGFIGVLFGVVKNVAFSGADITSGKNHDAGIVAGSVGNSKAQTSTFSMISNVVVSNSTITGARRVGAIVGQVLTAEASFDNCRVIDTKVIQTEKGTASYAGGFVGQAQADALYVDCMTTATVDGNEFTGGFAGYIGKGKFMSCRASGEVSGTKHVGGFVGRTENPVIENCWYDGFSISASDATSGCESGGFVGNAGRSGQYTNCYVKNAIIDAAGQRIGGFVGSADNFNTFEKCSVSGVTVNAGANSGGFVGVNKGNIYRSFVDGGVLNANGNTCGGFAASSEGGIEIHNCFTTMNVNGGAFGSIGGFAGQCKKKVSIMWCYSAGEITGTGSPIAAFAGKLDGNNTTIIKSCIAWNDTLQFVGESAGEEVVSDNYLGTEGTLAAKAEELGWDSDIWDFSAKLK